MIVYCPNEEAAQRWAEQLRTQCPPWLQDVVTAYLTVGVFFDADQIGLLAVCDYLRALPWQDVTESPRGHAPCRCWSIPVCYGGLWGPDLEHVATQTGLSPQEVIRCHQSVTYTVYAIGFAPGFPYLGYLPPPLCGVSRLPSPRQLVAPGSVGLAGRQTGIYPLPRPGGWQLIGRTPLAIVDLETAYFPLAVGDRIRFYEISASDFHRLEGHRLDEAYLSADVHVMQ